MNRAIKLILAGLVWIAIIAYLVWASDLASRHRAGVMTQELNIIVTDSADINIINRRMVADWVDDAGLNPVGIRLNDINTKEINDFVKTHNFVENSKTYVDINGRVSIELTQQTPIARVITDAGYNFYITEDGYILPVQKYSAHYVPVITGQFGLPFDKGFSGELKRYVDSAEKKSDKNYLFLCKLINFVEYIRGSEFWSAQIVQINVTTPKSQAQRGDFVEGGNSAKDPEIELIPRVGDHVILFGKLENTEEKLDKLLIFYNEALNKEGWNNWGYINLRYNNQVVCKK